MVDTIVIGAGISGLVCAYEIKRSGGSVLLLEAGNVGGKISSARINGFLLEAGPNSLRIDNQETRQLLDSLSLNDRLLEPLPSAKSRFILRSGTWRKVPTNPLEAIRTPLLSLPAKLRILREPWFAIGRSEESITLFISRRFGREVLDYAVDPFVSGVYAGNPDSLSLKQAFPILGTLEKQYGSVLRGAIRQRRNAKGEHRLRPTTISFPNGLNELTTALAESLRGELMLGTSVASLRYEGGRLFVGAGSNEFETRRVILSTPAFSAADIIRSIAPDAANRLNQIEYPPIAIAYLGYCSSDVSDRFNGFGGLIPSKEKRSVLGILHSSSTFTGRAPSDSALITVLMGGARHPEVGGWSEEQILSTATHEVAELYKLPEAPIFRQAQLWQGAIPQYNIGYDVILDELTKTEGTFPGLHFLGNYRNGISVSACIRNATELAARLV